MKEYRPSASLIRFGVYEVDLATEELRKNGLKIKLSGQPFQVLAMLMERPGAVVTREELRKKLWPDGTFVDFDHSLNTAINKIREALGDSAENPRFVETLARRGYRFIAPVEGYRPRVQGAEAVAEPRTTQRASDLHPRRRRILWAAMAVVSLLAIVATFLLYPKLKPAPHAPQRALTRLTFDAGLQFGATWASDGRFIAYSSDRGGKFDIWVQPVSGGDAVQVTKGPGHNWQPDWSPDGKLIAFRSERGEGGLYLVPAFGGPERKICSFGYYPRWSPDSSQILFKTHFAMVDLPTLFYVVGLDGNPPREVLREFLKQNKLYPRSATWHPDGKRISVWVRGPAPGPVLWTIPVDGGAAVKSEPAPGVLEQLREVTLSGATGARVDASFSWAPSGEVIYLERTFAGAKNLWRMAVERTLRANMVERLTTGPGPDTDFALSRDGKRLAFTSRTQQTRIWLFPFNATTGQITGKEKALTSPGMEAWRQTLSRDGSKLAFFVRRAGNDELWEKSLVDGREGPLAADEHRRWSPQWSPDGTRIAYTRDNLEADRSQLVVWSSDTRNEDQVTTQSTTPFVPYDWSADGKSLLVSRYRTSETNPASIWLLPLAAAPYAETKARKIVDHPAYDLYQSHVSPDGKWIVFEGVKNSPTFQESTLYVVSESGGPWTRITDGKYWDDKPRWSPDGKTIYLVSFRSGFFNVWGIRFDPVRGVSVGEPFQVTQFDSPALMIPESISAVEMSLTKDRLVLTMREASGSIWMLDNVDR